LECRIEFIDIARGLFIVWMIVGHSLSMAGVPLDHPLQWLRPTGWATFCFVLLTGVTIALVYISPGRVKSRTRAKLWRRAFEIGLIAFLSNSASRMVTASLSGELSVTYVWAVLTFQIPWTISSILIVTTCVLLSAPVLLWFSRTVPPLSLFLAVSTLTVGFDLLMQYDGKWIGLSAEVRQWLKAGGLFGFPVVPLVLYSIWLFCQANLAIKVSVTEGRWGVTALFAVLVGSSFAILMLGCRQLTCINLLTRFGVSIGIAMVIAEMGVFATPKALLGALGRVGLLVFIFHRPIIHIISNQFNEILSAPGLATVMIGLSLGPGLLVGIYRDRNARFSRALRNFWF
jgi:hypothetical protein